MGRPATAPGLLFVAHSLRMGGIEQLIARCAGAWVERGWRVHAGVMHGGGVLEEGLRDAGALVHDLHKREGLDAGLVWRLRRLMQRQRIDVVHTHNYSPWIYAGLSQPGSRVRLVHTEHSIVDGGFRRRLWAERWLSRSTDAVVAVSDDVRDGLVHLAGIDARRVRVIVNGVDTTHYAPSAALRSRARSELGIAADELVFGTVARLVPVKDQSTLVRAFGQVVELHQKSRLVLVGDGPLRADLEGLAAGLGLSARVVFAGQQRDAAPYLAAMDVFVLPSRSEGMSVSLLEAMASALPVLATRTGGNPQLVHEDVNGRLTPVGDVAALAIAMSGLAGDEAARRRLGAAGREICCRDYSFAAMLLAYEELYTQ